MTSLQIVDNRYVIPSRKRDLENLRKAPLGGAPRRVENGLVHMTPTPYYQALKLMQQLKDLGDAELPQTLRNKVEQILMPIPKEEKCPFSSLCTSTAR